MDTILQVLTLTTAVSLAFIALFFRAGLHEDVTRALAIFFLVNAGLWGGIFLAEVVFDVSRLDPDYLKWRAVIFRGALTASSVWLLYALHRKS